MSNTLQSARFNLQFVASLSNMLALETVSANPALSVAAVMANGTGANLVDQVWSDQRSLNPSTNENINVQTFSGSNDAVGGSLSLARVKGLIVQNLNGTEANNITLGGAGAGAWTPFMNGNSSLKVSIPGGGSLFAVAPGATAWAVGSSSGSLLNIANVSSTGTTQYNLIVVGASG
jgi:hypothetical protein